MAKGQATGAPAHRPLKEVIVSIDWGAPPSGQTAQSVEILQYSEARNL